jgi:hypothetical protein
MDSNSKKVTSVFIGVALAALAALALYVENQPEQSPQTPLEEQLPGLWQNLQSFEKFTGFPAEKIRSVRIILTEEDQVAVNRGAPGNAEFYFETEAPDNINPYSAVLFANAVFLDELDFEESFIVTGGPDKNAMILGRLVYTSFDGLVVEFNYLRADNRNWLRLVSARSQKLAERFAGTGNTQLLPKQDIEDVAKRLNGRLYKSPYAGF